ncbi:hypothetical protein LLG07_04125 [bacterium]|nr:hypothetical protein [bacterium]
MKKDNKAEGISKDKNQITRLKDLASFPELNPMPVFELGVNGDIKYMNPAAHANFPDILSKGIAHPFFSNWKVLVKKLRKDNLPYVSQDVKINGSWYLQMIIFVKSNKNYRIYASDITGRKLIEDSLFQKEREIAAILDSCPMLMILVDRERRIISSNNVLESFSKKTIKEIEGIRVGEALRCVNSIQDQRGCGFSPACKNCSIRNTLEETLTTGKNHYKVEGHLFYIKNGKQEESIFLLYTFFLKLSQECVIVWLQDITELKKSEEKINKLNKNLIQRANELEKSNKKLEDAQRAMLNILDDFNVERIKTEVANRELQAALEKVQQAKNATEIANKELEAFSYSVSHDLRAPLRKMDGFSYVLLEDYSDKLDLQAKQYLQRIRSSCQLMARLINDILNLSRITRSEIQLEKINLSELASEVARELRKETMRKVNFVIKPNIYAQGDRLLLKLVFENLLGNAFKFTSKRSLARIEFDVIQKDGNQIYFISDNGTGFDMAYADKLFKPFQRLHSDRDFPGTGVGLASVQRIIDRLGGKVWAEGEVDKGAIFYFTLR